MTNTIKSRRNLSIMTIAAITLSAGEAIERKGYKYEDDNAVLYVEKFLRRVSDYYVSAML